MPGTGLGVHSHNDVTGTAGSEMEVGEWCSGCISILKYRSQRITITVVVIVEQIVEFYSEVNKRCAEISEGERCVQNG